MADTETWAISRDGEEFSGEFDSRDDAVAAGRKDYEGNEFFVSKARRPMASEFVDPAEDLATWAVEMIDENTEAETGEILELEPNSNDAAKELETLIKAWADKTFGKLDVFLMDGEPEKITD